MTPLKPPASLRLHASCTSCHAGEEAGLGGPDAAIGVDGFGALVCLSCGQSAVLSPSLHDYLIVRQDPALLDVQVPRLLEVDAC